MTFRICNSLSSCRREKGSQETRSIGTLPQGNMDHRENNDDPTPPALVNVSMWNAWDFWSFILQTEPFLYSHLHGWCARPFLRYGFSCWPSVSLLVSAHQTVTAIEVGWWNLRINAVFHSLMFSIHWYVNWECFEPRKSRNYEAAEETSRN